METRTISLGNIDRESLGSLLRKDFFSYVERKQLRKSVLQELKILLRLDEAALARFEEEFSDLLNKGINQELLIHSQADRIPQNQIANPWWDQEEKVGNALFFRDEKILGFDEGSETDIVSDRLHVAVEHHVSFRFPPP